MFIELHMLQNFAPSNLNRDDTGNPKECDFGGARRARISSQCLKRAIRTAPVFAETTAAPNGQRTRWLTRRLRDALQKAGKPEDESDGVAFALAEAYSGKMDSTEKDRTRVLLFLSEAEIEHMVTDLLADWGTVAAAASKTKVDSAPFKELVKELIRNTKKRTGAPDIALFGRMLADKPETNIDAACQIAHAISTHRVNMEIDFFTAMDDLQPSSEPGAGMMGTQGFNSACFYRYARLDWGQLVINLADDVALARRTVEGFIRAAEAAIPSGKQNSTAPHSRPSLMLATARENDAGWSLANAFENPVYPQAGNGLVAASAQALSSYWEQLCQVYGTESLGTVAVLALQPELPLSKGLQAANVSTFADFVQQVVTVLPEA